MGFSQGEFRPMSPGGASPKRGTNGAWGPSGAKANK